MSSTLDCDNALRRTRIAITHSGCALLSLLLCLPTTGCGLLRIPYRVTLPRADLQHVRVLPTAAYDPLPDATVTLLVFKHQNWMPPRSAWGFCPSPSIVTARFHDDAQCESCPAQCTPDGTFIVPAQQHTGWRTLWWPWPCLLGPWLYDTCDAILIVSAPGHATLWLTNNATLPLLPEQCDACDPPASRSPTEFCDNILYIHLPQYSPPLNDGAEGG